MTKGKKGKNKEYEENNSQKKGKKTNTTVVDSSYEELMKEGVKLEEQGERYGRDEKAKRFYERAIEMYKNAHEKNPNDADSLYNWGRVLYILVDFASHNNVDVTITQKLDLLDESIDKFRKALSIDANNADALFNLAQALTTKAEFIEDQDETYKAADLLKEAIQAFDRVYVLQIKELEENNCGIEEHDDTNNNGGDGGNENLKGSTETETITEIIPVTKSTIIDTLIANSKALVFLGSIISDHESIESYYTEAIKRLEKASSFVEPSTSSESMTNIQLQWAELFSSQAERVFQETGNVQQHLYEKAIQKLDKVITELDKENAEALCDRELYSNSIKSFESALFIEPKNISILQKLAYLNHMNESLLLPFYQKHHQQGINNGYIKAVDYYKQALDINKDSLETYLFYALELSHLPNKEHEIDECLKEFERRGGSKEIIIKWQIDNEELLNSSDISKGFVQTIQKFNA
ncbi:9924_t:CDS:2 [Entrophospora sp. SA101]|nr:9924_t:CDS:2 [Entrophospora sp. SA101]